MSRRFLDFFQKSSKATAAVAKERLQIIVAQQRRQGGMPDFLPRLQNDILEVIRRYVTVADDAVDIQIDRANGGCDVLELNITLPETHLLAIDAPNVKTPQRATG